MKLTQPDVPRLEPGEYRDDEIRGLLFRVRETGLRSFELRYTLPATGERARLTLGASDVMTLKQAREKAKTLMGGVWTGSDPAKELRRSGGITVGQLAAKYLRSAKISEKTRKEWARMSGVDLKPRAEGEPPPPPRKFDIEPIAHLEAAMLRRHHIRDLGEAISARSGYVANRVFQMLRRFFSWGVKQGHLEASPFVSLEKPFDGEKTRDRYLSIDEVRALLASLKKLSKGERGTFGENFAAATELLLLTGVRRESMIEARRSDFFNLDHEDAAEWRIRPPHLKLRERKRAQAKNHVVPLSRQAVALVRLRIEATKGAEILFPRSMPSRGSEKATAWWSSWFMRKLKRNVAERLATKPEPWTVHCLRATLTTHMEEALGVPKTITDAIIGHKSAIPPDEGGPSAAHGVYSLGEHMKARREALQHWADWLDSLRWAPMRRG